MMNRILLVLLLGTFNLNAKVTFDLSGRMEVDYSIYNDDVTQFTDNDYDIRRFRFGLYTKFNDKFSSYFQSDFSNYEKTKKGDTQAAWIRFKPDEKNAFHLGQMEMPFSLESVSNSKYHFFMERSIASALTERFGTGINYTHFGDDWNLRLGVFGEENFKQGKSNKYGHSFTGRIAKKFKAFNGKLYLGLSAEYRDPKQRLRIRTLPESHTFRARLVNTGKFSDTKSIIKYGLEALWKNNDWTFQSEFIQDTFNQPSNQSITFSGGYFLLSRIFNGKRRFSFKKGEWASTRVKDWRTFEISLRSSFLDLQEPLLDGGKEQNTSFGINYYLNRNSRIMFNFIIAKASPNSKGINETLNIYQIRFQYEFL